MAKMTSEEMLIWIDGAKCAMDVLDMTSTSADTRAAGYRHALDTLGNAIHDRDEVTSSE